MSTVGKSSRTPFKHWILKKELGRLCGIFGHPVAASKCPAIPNPFLVVDLCAGDGVSGDNFDSSPQIIINHLQYAIAHNVSVECHLIEKMGKTFELLDMNTPDQPWIHKVYGDARQWTMPPAHRQQAIFIHSDPNHIHDWPITDELIGNLSETTTMLATLGCNVGGLKMMERNQREQWYEHVRKCTLAMPAYHDAVLVSLEGDKAQWAYLLRLPSKWSEETQQTIATAGRKWSEYDFNIASLRDSREAFDAMQDVLFLTRKERALCS